MIINYQQDVINIYFLILCIIYFLQCVPYFFTYKPISAISRDPDFQGLYAYLFIIYLFIIFPQ